MGGFLAGLATGVLIIDKYQEAWSEEYYPARRPRLPFNANNCWTGTVKSQGFKIDYQLTVRTPPFWRTVTRFGIG